uniref:EB domain-containing protein n=1 Tax=Steinernema glaseri TaxID=37863 RepID=A0A1I8ATH6_9BILA
MRAPTSRVRVVKHAPVDPSASTKRPVSVRLPRQCSERTPASPAMRSRFSRFGLRDRENSATRKSSAPKAPIATTASVAVREVTSPTLEDASNCPPSRVLPRRSPPPLRRQSRWDPSNPVAKGGSAREDPRKHAWMFKVLSRGPFSCDTPTGLCQCPVGHVAMGGQCVRPQTTTIPMTTSYVRAAARPGECSDDTQCGANSNCVVGRCKCRPGFQLKEGVCAPLENVSVSFSKPRVKGPPLRRPVTTTPRTLSALRTAPGAGVCPPGNEPLKDDGGRLVVCNGVEPNCPPRSYCYVTGVASEDYNCCKSW